MTTMWTIPFRTSERTTEPHTFAGGRTADVHHDSDPCQGPDCPEDLALVDPRERYGWLHLELRQPVIGLLPSEIIPNFHMTLKFHTPGCLVAWAAAVMDVTSRTTAAAAAAGEDEGYEPGAIRGLSAATWSAIRAATL